MLPKQRQAYILDRVRESGGVRVTDLVEALGVSDMTIRRDLHTLEVDGLVEKVHGGATTVSERASYEPGFAAKSTMQRQEKDAIAAVAAAMVQPGTAIGISAGTTTFALARRLVDMPRLTVVTNSIWVADVLHREGASDQTVVLTGGRRTPSDALVGPFAVAALRNVHLDQVFMGVHGLDVKAGLTTPNLMEAETDRALVEAGRCLVVVADHTKWGAVGISSIACLSQVDVLVTDGGFPPSAQAELNDHAVEVVLADEAQSSAGATG